MNEFKLWFNISSLFIHLFNGMLLSRLDIGFNSTSAKNLQTDFGNK